jgi:hypothetical protein
MINSTIQTAWENRDKIVSDFEENELRIKQLQSPE